MARFGPWVWWALGVLLVTGALMIVGEPPRELLAISFWMKMALVASGWPRRRRCAAARSRRSRRRRSRSWVCVIVLGRLIAYDYVWGSWSTWMKG